MKTSLKILALLYFSLSITGCVSSQWATFDPNQAGRVKINDSTYVSVDASRLIVPVYNTDIGENLFLIAKNVKPGTVQSLTVNGIFIGDFATGDGLYVRFTDLIYRISESTFDQIYDDVTRGRRVIKSIKIVIQVDLISGKSGRPHWSKDFWISDAFVEKATAKLEF